MKEIEVRSDTPVDPKNEGSNLYVEGYLSIEGPIVDPDFGFVAEGHQVLHRKIEVLMW